MIIAAVQSLEGAVVIIGLTVYAFVCAVKPWCVAKSRQGVSTDDFDTHEF